MEIQIWRWGIAFLFFYHFEPGFLVFQVDNVAQASYGRALLTLWRLPTHFASGGAKAQCREVSLIHVWFCFRCHEWYFLTIHRQNADVEENHIPPHPLSHNYVINTELNQPLHCRHHHHESEILWRFHSVLPEATILGDATGKS